ncbi:RluA family pseudouridine synthase [Paenibacillus sp. 481]|uniref:RluA family pseudouridine synthase n=1 Tax=Paenibacillus sp. 481 TaxID=2835869 RepID=UPI001E5B80D9|nr:RluA family pseudouridine synthase [Paenibacillus sp. 481]UHA74368.1 RluA family pseudouridine synthase [Paenibacillus sp. 481]
MKQHWKRRGEWLELMPGKAVLASDETLHNWLLQQMRMPNHMLRTMLAQDGIRKAGDRLRLHVFKPEACDVEAGDQPAHVLYEDEACLVVYKPAGMPVHASTPAQEAARQTLAHAVACHYAWTGQEARIRHIHRLDVETTGPVLYAKQAFTHAVLDDMMREKDIHRQYAAIVQGTLVPPTGSVDEPIGKDKYVRGRRRVSPTGDKAITHYETLQQGRALSLVRLVLETGRTHQIRVHLSHKGCPLVGDTLYGGDGKLLARQALHGEQLQFTHPISHERITVTAPWPEDLERLRQKI